MTSPAPFCPRCGSAAAPGSRFCCQCGGHLNREEFPGLETAGVSPSAPALGETREEPPGEIAWEIDIPLLTNRFILYDTFKVWGISSLVLVLLMLVIFIWDRNWRALTGMLPVVGGVSAFLLVVLILVMLLFFGNRFPLGFRLDHQGAAAASLSRRGQWGNRLAVILGAFSGRPGLAGAGLLGMARETVAISWEDVRRVNVHPHNRVISLMDNWHVALRLYCTAANYGAVLKTVETLAARGLRRGEEENGRRAKSPSRGRLLLKSLTAAVAAFLLTALPLETPPALLWGLLLTGLGALWFQAFARILGGVCLVLAGALVLVFAAQGLEVRQTTTEKDFREFARSRGMQVDQVPDWVLGRHRRFGRFHPRDWLQTGIAALGLSFFVWTGYTAVRPRRRPRRGGSNSPEAA
jgi:hypothetical protein